MSQKLRRQILNKAKFLNVTLAPNGVEYLSGILTDGDESQLDDLLSKMVGKGRAITEQDFSDIRKGKSSMPTSQQIVITNPFESYDSSS
jgi:hypothetical protein